MILGLDAARITVCHEGALNTYICEWGFAIPVSGLEIQPAFRVLRRITDALQAETIIEQVFAGRSPVVVTTAKCRQQAVENEHPAPCWALLRTSHGGT